MSDTQVATAERSNFVITKHGLRFDNFNDLWRFSTMLAKTDFVPPGWTAEKCMVAIQFGAEVGLSPMQALQNVGVVNGKPFLYGDAPLALCRQSPEWEGSSFREWTEGSGDKLTAFCQVGRRGEQPIMQSFSWGQAREAGLTGKDLWKKYPTRMLQFKPRQWALRDKFGDVLKGLVSEEEAREIAESNGNAPRAAEARMVSSEAEPARKELPDAQPTLLPPQATAEPARASGTPWTADQIKDPAMARLERQEAAAEAKTATKTDRDTIVRLRRYAERVRDEGLRWKDFVKGDPHGMTDEVLESIMHRMEGALTDAFFEKQQLPEAKDPGKVPEREPGEDDDQGEAGAAVPAT